MVTGSHRRARLPYAKRYIGNYTAEGVTSCDRDSLLYDEAQRRQARERT